ncbi:plasmid stabilization system protein [Gloeobacter kilaueensis JS1]|uniref:Plasmid stabilization system protein n=1 Tax=Gloeobacter kilaueensis (strain ATCC BAA-2537 / CCAP 1431/1 / ULC 316 / JS1) TaxID=1183438 RepID=U5QFS6_GLOK1|nr:plasmid stabilization system protein [Gloeobacter kilaueensis JS1]
MSKPVLFTPIAVEELLEAQDWYESQLPGLGTRFRNTVDTTVASIAAQPMRYPIVFQEIVHRALLRPFPYSLFFCIEPDIVLVIACFHTRRDPKQWQQRI